MNSSIVLCALVFIAASVVNTNASDDHTHSQSLQPDEEHYNPPPCLNRLPPTCGTFECPPNQTCALCVNGHCQFFTRAAGVKKACCQNATCYYCVGVQKRN